MGYKLINICVIVLQIVCVSSYNILGIFPLTGKSHFLVYEPILKGLSEKGHNVTVLGYFPLNEGIKNYRDIVVGDMDIYYDNLDKSNLQNLSKVDTSRRQIYSTFLILSFLGRESCKLLFESEKVQNFLKEDNKFNIVL